MFTTCCYVCGSEEVAQRIEFMDQKGMIYDTETEPCGDHNRLVIYHKPWNGDLGAEYEQMYHK